MTKLSEISAEQIKEAFPNYWELCDKQYFMCWWNACTEDNTRHVGDAHVVFSFEELTKYLTLVDIVDSGTYIIKKTEVFDKEDAVIAYFAYDEDCNADFDPDDESLSQYFVAFEDEDDFLSYQNSKGYTDHHIIIRIQ